MIIIADLIFAIIASWTQNKNLTQKEFKNEN